MLSFVKKILYFPLAWYFRFFAAIRLRRWNPRVIVITGSNGKTTLFHLLESQIGKQARYSYHANSSFGLPFSILGLKRNTLFKTEWLSLFLLAPFRVLAPLPKESIFVAEADCDRPGEGKFLAKFLKPEVVIWVSVSRTHSMSFDKLVDQKKFNNVDDAISYEFGYFLEYCSELAIINGDSPLQIKESYRTKAKIEKIQKENNLAKYLVKKSGTEFQIGKNLYNFSAMLPEEVFYAIQMCKSVVEYLQFEFDTTFKNFTLPPGRGSVFKGLKNTTIIDSCYNANLASMSAILNMYKKFPGGAKWAILGDMLEQGREEKEEHEKLADLILSQKFEKIILMGPRVCKYTYPKLIDKISVEKFLGPKEVLDYILNNIRGEEILLFKGARFMEGIIENLLVDKNDIKKLARREDIWEIRRKKWGL